MTPQVPKGQDKARGEVRLPALAVTCETCGSRVSVPQGTLKTICHTCEADVARSREVPPRFTSGSSRRQRFSDTVGRLPYFWIWRKSFGNLERFSSARSFDMVSLVIALAPLATFGILLWLRSNGISLGTLAGNLPDALPDGLFVDSIGFLILLGVPCEVLSSSLHRRFDVARWSRWKLTSWLWRVQRARRTWRIALVTAGLALASVGLAMIMRGTGSSRDILPALISIDTVLLTLWGVLLTTQLSFRTVGPEEYASVVLGGRKVEDVFRWVAWDMLDLCESFDEYEHERLRAVRRRLLALLPLESTDAQKGAALLRQMQQVVEEVGEKRLAQTIDNLERRLLSLRLIIRRCIAMKRLASQEFEIEERRLCDHIFRFSPSIFEQRTAKYVRNWRTILASVQAKDVSWRRVGDLLEENARISGRIGRRANYLRLVVASRRVYEGVRVFASRSSLREALTEYAASLAAAAETKDVSEALPSRLQMLYLMQGAHPGAALHRSLLSLCSGAVEWCYERCSQHEVRIDFWNKVTPSDPRYGTALQAIESAKAKSYHFKLQAQRWQTIVDALIALKEPHLKSFVDDYRRALTRLPAMVSAATHNTQWELNHRLQGELATWLRGRENVVVITYGLSRVVRDAIKSSVSPMLSPSDRIFVARSEDRALESRTMAFLLREDDRWHQENVCAKLGFGDAKLLISLLRSHPEYSVLVLLGAEAFDKKGRFIQLAGSLDEVAQLAALQQSSDGIPSDASHERVLIAVLAESYKRSGDQLAESELFADHLDEVALYDSGLASIIVSNDGVLECRQHPVSTRS